jgi:hypothetical protein
MGRRLKAYAISTPGTTSIATTGNTDEYLIVPKTGKVIAAYFSSLAALATHEDNHVTFSITNLGQAGAGTAAILAATAANTTDTTGGTALAANTKRSLALTSTAADLNVTEGDRLLVRFAAAGTLAGAVTRPVVTILINASGA